MNPYIAVDDSVFIVDDSSVQRAYTAAICNELGITNLLEAKDGADALAMLQSLERKPVLMLLDLEMPGMDGIELIQQMSEKSIDIAIVVLSSTTRSLLDTVETMSRSLQMRILGSLTKPFSVEDLRAVLQRNAPSATRGQAQSRTLQLQVEDLRSAINNGELTVHYQPKLNFRSGECTGVEALARWPHARLGMIPPDQFIPLAEREGLIKALTATILEQSLTQLAKWHGLGIGISLAVNLSPQVLESSALANGIIRLTKKLGLKNEDLILEITESSVVTSSSTSLGTLARLRLRGFRLSIDDYGTGYSSLQQLARFPFTELKIDRSFVNGIHQKDNLRIILKSALGLAVQLNLDSVAEGIETVEDWRLLQSYHCTLGQGYFIARPMPAEAFPAWLESHRERIPSLLPAAKGTSAKSSTQAA